MSMVLISVFDGHEQAGQGAAVLRAMESQGAVDLNAGLEFRITKNLNVWTQFNNIFNKEYEPWKLYKSYGFSFLGGVIFAFDQKTK